MTEYQTSGARSDIEIIQPDGDNTIVTPSKVRINGVEALVTDAISVSPIADSDFVTCTITFLVSSLYVGPER